MSYENFMKQHQEKAVGAWYETEEEDGDSLVTWSNGKPQPLAKMLLHSHDTISCSSTFFDPAKPPSVQPTLSAHGDQLYNLWQGLAVRPEAGDWAGIRQLMQQDLCGYDAEATDLRAKNKYEFLVAQCARWVRLPGEKASIALVFSGARGTGKGTFANEVMGAFFGQGLHYAKFDRMESITGAFNHAIATTVLCVLEEAQGSNTYAARSALKTLLGDSVLEVRQKFMDSVFVQSHQHLIINSNESHCVPAECDDRNYARFNVPGLERTAEHWERLHAAIDDHERAAFLDFLLRAAEATRCMGLHDSRHIPACFDEDRLADKLLTMSHDPVKRWLYDELCKARPLEALESQRKHDDTDVAYLPDDLYAHFNDWCIGKPVNRYNTKSCRLFMGAIKIILPESAEFTYGHRKTVAMEPFQRKGPRCFATTVDTGKRGREEGDRMTRAQHAMRTAFARLLKTPESLVFADAHELEAFDRGGSALEAKCAFATPLYE
jgi:hypothetical protein